MTSRYVTLLKGVMGQCSAVLAMFPPRAFTRPSRPRPTLVTHANLVSLVGQAFCLDRCGPPSGSFQGSPFHYTLGASAVTLALERPNHFLFLARLMRKTVGDYYYVIKRLNRASRFRAQRSRGRVHVFQVHTMPKKRLCREWRCLIITIPHPPKTLLRAYLIRCSPIIIFLTSSRPSTACHFLEASTRAGSRHVAFPPPLLPIKSPPIPGVLTGTCPLRNTSEEAEQFLDSFQPRLQPRLQPRHHAFPAPAIGSPGTPRSSLPV